ncbi:MAG TPA: pyridoxal-phosphate dependent enzyme [Saprospiraceae bacterium]|nr:pyridoxal-phosphate dependent enzyme [Saprospiraceae bacterium]HMQ83841.1 pyridoxal-phosphate dependent enzyme [Saprospiraceae bacterium]
MALLQVLSQIPTASDIEITHEAIAPMIHRTPIFTNKSINDLCGAELFFKCENLQKIGAFKMRGAASAALRLSDEQRARGLATHSSGNHAQAVALSAQLLGVPAYIVMPDVSPAIKVAATRAYQAEITLCENNQQAREKNLERVVAETGAYFIHPYNDYHVIAGQATAAKELIEDAPVPLDIIIAPVGGGGLLSGTALSTRYFSAGTKVFGAEPKEVDDAWRSFTTKQRQQNSTINTIADGLRTNLGDKTFDIILKEVDAIFTVSEAGIIQAMRLIWERMKLVVEPSGAVPLAAILEHPAVFEGKKTGIIFSGGNVELSQLPF